MDRHCANALEIAKWLEARPEVERVHYPHLESHPQYALAKKQMKQGGGIVAFDLKGGLEAGRQFLSRIQMCSLSSNLGDTRTIVTHPATTTHSKLSQADRSSVGIGPGMIRVSVGLELLFFRLGNSSPMALVNAVFSK